MPDHVHGSINISINRIFSPGGALAAMFLSELKSSKKYSIRWFLLANGNRVDVQQGEEIERR
jgi:hypothetical protein